MNKRLLAGLTAVGIISNTGSSGAQQNVVDTLPTTPTTIEITPPTGPPTGIPSIVIPLPTYEPLKPEAVCSQQSILALPPATAILFEEDTRYQTVLENTEVWNEFRTQAVRKYMQEATMLQDRTAATPEEWQRLGAYLPNYTPQQNITEQQAFEKLVVSAKICAQLETEIVFLRAVKEERSPSSLPVKQAPEKTQLSPASLQKRTAMTAEEWKALGAQTTFFEGETLKHYSDDPYRELELAAHFYEQACTAAMPPAPNLEFTAATTLLGEGIKFVLKKIPAVGVLVELGSFVVTYGAERYNRIWNAAYLDEKVALNEDEGKKERLRYLATKVGGTVAQKIITTTIKQAFERPPSFLAERQMTEGIVTAAGKETAKTMIAEGEYHSIWNTTDPEQKTRFDQLRALHLVTLPAVPYLCSCASDQEQAKDLEGRRIFLEKLVELGVTATKSLGFTATQNWYDLLEKDSNDLCPESHPACAASATEFIEAIRKNFEHTTGLWEGVAGYGHEYTLTVRITRDSALMARVLARYGSTAEALRSYTAINQFIPHKNGVYASLPRREVTALFLMDSAAVLLNPLTDTQQLQTSLRGIEARFPEDEGARIAMLGDTMLGAQGEAEFVLGNVYLSRAYYHAGEKEKADATLKASREALEDLALIREQVDIIGKGKIGRNAIEQDPILNAAFAAAYCEMGKITQGKLLLKRLESARRKENGLYDSMPVWYPFQTYELFPQAVIADALLACNCPYTTTSGNMTTTGGGTHGKR